ncbi:MAG: DUF4430 domain-containing protein [Candidatus Berkelbacteria bacterium]
MNKLFKSLMFPALSLLIVTLIYGGLSIASLNNQAKELKKENQARSSSLADLQNQLSQIQNKVNQTLSLNDNLQQSLSAAQKQISGLQAKPAVQTASAPTIITKTITQTVDRLVVLNQATITIENVGSYKVDLQSGDNAFNILQRAASQNNFALKYDTYSFGVFVTGIGGIVPTGNQYWAFYYNGAFSNVGALDQPVQQGDSIFWQLASF